MDMLCDSFTLSSHCLCFPFLPPPPPPPPPPPSDLFFCSFLIFFLNWKAHGVLCTETGIPLCAFEAIGNLHILRMRGEGGGGGGAGETFRK